MATEDGSGLSELYNTVWVRHWDITGVSTYTTYILSAQSWYNTGFAENKVFAVQLGDSIKTIHLNRKSPYSRFLKYLLWVPLFTVFLMAHLSSNQYGQSCFFFLLSKLFFCNNSGPNEGNDRSSEQVHTWQTTNWPCRFLVLTEMDFYWLMHH